MAHLSKHPSGKQRVRYTLVFSDGSTKDRSRLYGTLKESRAILHRAGLLEENLRFRRYDANDLAQWRGLGLISSKDQRALAAALPPEATAFNRTLGDAAADYRQTWTFPNPTELSAKKELSANKARLRRILGVLGPGTPIAALKYQDGEILKMRLLETGLAPSTINRCIQDLKRMINMEVANAYIPYNPFISLKGIRNKNKFQGKVMTPQKSLLSKITSQARQMFNNYRLFRQMSGKETRT